MTKLMLLPFMLMATLAAVQSQAKTDIWTGTWTLDVGKSTLHDPAPKNETAVIRSGGTDSLAFKYHVTGTGADGKAIDRTLDGRADGKAYPAISDGKAVSQASYVRVTNLQLNATVTRPDGSTTTEVFTMAPDGKSFSIKEHTKGKQGEYDVTAVFTRS
jgi:hypothetical protein